MAKQKIIHILYSGLGGTTEYVFNLIKADVSQEYENVILFYGIESPPSQQLLLAEKLVSKVIFIHKKQGYDRKSFKQVSELLKKEKPNIIALHINSLILTCAKYKDAKLIFVEHQANHLKTRKEWLWTFIAQYISSYIVSFTDLYQKELKKRLSFFYSTTKNIIINTGIDLALYNNLNTKTSEKIKVGIISRINGFRDHETLLKAFSLLQYEHVELYIAGNGSLKNGLETKFFKRVNWVGFLDQDGICELLKKLDIYVIASFGESTSIALMQAQASRLPIIATNVKGINNVLTDENCVFVEPKSITDYKNALELLIKDEVKRNQLATKSLEYANNNLSHFRMFDAYKKLIEE